MNETDSRTGSVLGDRRIQFGDEDGYVTIGFSEIESAAATVLAAHWPNVPNLGDIRGINRSTVHGDVHILTAGVPCQPASTLGKRRGTADERWLWPEAIRVVRELRPWFCVFENPPAILTLESGGAFNGIVSELSALGYDLWWEVVPACAVGAGHRRERLFIVAAYTRSVTRSLDAGGAGGAGGEGADREQYDVSRNSPSTPNTMRQGLEGHAGNEDRRRGGAG